MRVHELDASIQMMLYTDHSYSEAYSSAPSIELRDKVGRRSSTSLTKYESNVSEAICIISAMALCVQVYVEVTVKEPADFFLLRVNECWATQSSQPNTTEGSAHTLLKNGSEQVLDINNSSHFSHFFF